MSSDNFVQPSIPRFDGQHFDHWCMLMENFLRSKEYWQVIEPGIPEAAAGTILTDAQKTEVEALKLKDLKAKNYLFQAIDRPILETILKKDTCKQIWDSMKTKHQGNARAKRMQLQALRNEFENLKMKVGESVTDYFSRTMAIVNKMRINGDALTDVAIVEKILRSMTAKFNYVVCSIEEANDTSELSLDELQSSLLVHECKMDRQDTEEQALQAAANSKGDSRWKGKKQNTKAGERQAGSNQRKKTVDKSKIECFRCHKYGHFRSECRAYLNRDRGERSNFVEKEETEEEISLLMVCHSKENTHKNMWYLDTGCSNHMCGDRSVFSELDESFHNTVKFGDNSTVPVEGKGKVSIQTNSNSIRTISDVLFVPTLKTNLLSVGQLQEKGYEIIIKDGVCAVHDAQLGLIAKVKMTPNRMFPLYIQNTPFSCLSTKLKDAAWLWHFRYGHLNFGGLKVLQQKEMVVGLPHFDSPSEICGDCTVSKQHRDSFPKGKSWRAKNVLELVHSDLCGPINPTSNGGKRYFITFVDDFSRKSWVYFLQHKNEALSVFKNFKALVEKESGRSIKALRTDRGGEYNSTEFANFCESNGIKRQMTAAYTPQQNGVCERRNRTVMNMVRSFLTSSSIPKVFWPEAVNWSIHVLNRCPTFSVRNKTPEEAWSGHKPTVDYFRVFGCVAYAHVPDEKRRKLDDKGEMCVFLGVSNQAKAYKLYNPSTKKIVVSRDVVFDEEKMWEWNEKEPSKSLPVEFDEDEGESQQQVENGQPEQQSPTPPSDSQVDPNSSRPQRIRRRPEWMQDYEVTDLPQIGDDSITYYALFSDCDPLTFEEAVKEEKWQKAMAEEIASIEKNHTWELTDLPEGQKSIGVKWVYKTKLKEDGEVDKFKARLVAKGYKQEFGVDYKEVFAPVARLDTIRLVIALAAQKSWPIFQLDVKSAFLHGDLEEQVFVNQPPGFIKSGSEHKVYKLRKALYGLKQAPRAWYGRINSYFLKEGFVKCPYEHTLYIKNEVGGKMLVACLYVDDLIFTGNNEAMLVNFKESMKAEFDMSDLGSLHYFLGLEVVQNSAGIFVSQRKYVGEILKKFKMADCNPVKTPIEVGVKLMKDLSGADVNSTLYKQIVGSLMYLTATRPDISYAVSLISRYMEHPKESHLKVAKRILRYLKGTTELGLFYRKGDDLSLMGFTDSDYAGDFDDRKSTSGYVFMIGSGVVSFSSKKQPIVTLSTTEAEYVAATSGACQAIWLKRILEELQFGQGAVPIFCDNSSTIKLSKNPVLHGRTKHIDVRYHFLRNLVEDGEIDLLYCRSEDQIADILTKPLKLPTFLRLRWLLGVCKLEDQI